MTTGGSGSFGRLAAGVRLWLAGFVACVVAVSGVAQQQTSTETFNAVAARASAARMADRYDEAIGLYEQALKLQYSWAEGWWYLGTLLYEKDRYADALAPFATLANLKPDGGAAWAMLGLCEFQLGKYWQAMEHLQRGRAIGLQGEGRLAAVAEFHVAILLNRFGNPEAALQLLYSVARQEDESPALLQGLGLSALSLPVLLPKSHRTNASWC